MDLTPFIGKKVCIHLFGIMGTVQKVDGAFAILEKEDGKIAVISTDEVKIVEEI